MYDPIYNTRVYGYWAPYASNPTDIRQFVAVEMPPFIQGQSGVSAHIPMDAIASIQESDIAVTIVLKKGPYVVFDAKPAPPKPTVWDFVPDYKRLMAKLMVGDLSVLGEFIALQGSIMAAGLTIQAVAAAAGSGGK